MILAEILHCYKIVYILMILAEILHFYKIVYILVHKIGSYTCYIRRFI